MDYRNPIPTVDIIVSHNAKIILIKRKNPPFGWALPGGFVDEGESVEQAAIREAKEELSLDVTLQELLYVYSSPDRDPRKHTMSVVFTATAKGPPVPGDDATESRYFALDALPVEIVFDHRKIITDFLHFQKTGNRPSPNDQ